MSAKVIIVGISHHNTLSLVRSFGMCGLKIVFVTYGAGENYVSNSKFVEETIKSDNAEEAISLLLNKLKELTEKPVIITADDDAASLIDLKYNEFVGLSYFFNAGETGRITYYMDKERQSKLASACGFYVPMSVECTTDEMSGIDIPFPLIIKPKESIHGGKKIRICNDAEEMSIAKESFQDVNHVLIQEYIDKNHEIVILGCSVNGSIVIPGYVVKHRDYLGGTTYSTVYPSTNLDKATLEASRKLIGEIRYEGLFGIECIYSKGKYYFIEVNLRNDATTYSLCIAGANLPMYYYNKILGLGDEVALNARIIRSMVEFNDFFNVLKFKINPFTWIGQCIKCECKYFYCSNDKEPFKRQMKMTLKMIINKIIN